MGQQMTAKIEHLTHLPAWPRLLSREQAAAYCGLGTGSFDRWNVVQPIRVGRRLLYDRHAIDRAIDKLAGFDPKDDGEDDEAKALAAIAAGMRGKKSPKPS